MTPTPQPDSRDGERKCPTCSIFGTLGMVPLIYTRADGFTAIGIQTCPTCGGTGKAKGERDG